HDPERRVADQQLVIRRKCEAGAESAEVGDSFDAPGAVDPVNLPRLAAGPEHSFAVKGEAFRMIEVRCEYRKLLDRDFRDHATRAIQGEFQGAASLRPTKRATP